MIVRASLLISTALLAAACTDPGLPEAPPGVDDTIAIGARAPGMVGYRPFQRSLELRSLDGERVAAFDGYFPSVIQRADETVLVDLWPGRTSSALVLDGAGHLRRRVDGLPEALYVGAGAGYLALTRDGFTVRAQRLDANFSPIGPAIAASSERLVAARDNDLVVIDPAGDQVRALRFDRAGALLDDEPLAGRVFDVVAGTDGYLVLSRDDDDDVSAAVLADGAVVGSVNLGPEETVVAAPGVLSVSGTHGWGIAQLSKGSLTFSSMLPDGRPGYNSYPVMVARDDELRSPSIASLDGDFLITALGSRGLTAGDREVTVRAVTVDIAHGPGPVMDLAVSRW